MADRALPARAEAISFGPFRLLPAQQLLLEGDKPVRLGSRALDILAALVERPGELVSRDELMARVWPGIFVEEGNLRVHLAAVRRALGDGRGGRRYIANVPGRGYRFVEPVSAAEPGSPSAPPPAPIEPTHDFPRLLVRIVGRDDVVLSLVAQLPKRRFMTIVGPGGIGKTTVALAVADRLLARYPDGARFLDLATLGDSGLVMSTLASALGLSVHSAAPLGGLLAFLKEKRMLLVFDSCEQVVGEAAILCEEIARNAPGVHILATSQEPLRAEGEQVLRLSALELPPVSAGLSADQALAFPAVQLFVERAAANFDSFELTDALAADVAEICLRLDGNPLAIELAASRIDAFGARGLAERLDDRFGVLTRGRRTAVRRHHSLAATLDWSYELLPEAERVLLRRLAIFSGTFDLSAAGDVAGGRDFNAYDVCGLIANIVAKSLVVADVGGPSVQYRLLDTTRAYAREKLVASGELEALARRHAEHLRVSFERAEADSETMPGAAWLTPCRPWIDDLRAALDWAFSPGGDAALGVALTVAAVPLWNQLPLVQECRRWVERALAAPQESRSERQAMQLHAALGWSLMYTALPPGAIADAWATVLALAERLGDTDYQLRALWALWVGSLNNGELRDALETAARFCSLAGRTPDVNDELVGERMTGATLYFLGELSEARRRIEHVLARYVRPRHEAHIVRFQYDQPITAWITLSRVLWLQGFADQAMHTVELNIKEALSTGHTLSLCNALVQAACPLAMRVGDLAAAERFLALLLEQTTAHGLDGWGRYGAAFEAALLIARGDLDGGLPLLRTTVDALRGANFLMYYTGWRGALAEGLARGGRLAEAETTIDEAIERCVRREERWCVAELLRIKGELIRKGGGPDAAAAAKSYFLRAAEIAERQGALAWQLRIAMALARLQHEEGRPDEARDQLSSVYSRFTEGFGTSDVRAARSLLEELGEV